MEGLFHGNRRTISAKIKGSKTQVGSCIINPDNKHILSIGYNGLPHGFNDDEFDWNSNKEDFLANKNSYVVHAEANAILNSTTNLEGSHIYVTMFPCNECAKLIAQSRIKKVIYKDDKFLHKDQGKVSLKIFEKAGIEIEKFGSDD